MTRLATAACVVALCAVSLSGVAADNTYKDGEQVKVIANNVGPFSNPAETYRYYSLPFCQPKDVTTQSQQLGEVLAGDRRVNTLYDIQFKVDVHRKDLCTRTLSPADIATFAKACEEDYYLEMFLDDLPMWTFVGEHEHEDILLGHTKNSKHYLYTHLHFSIAYNKNQVIAVNVSSDPSQHLDITMNEGDAPHDVPVSFTYSVKWVPTTVTYEDRHELSAQTRFLPVSLEIHWLSVINSLVLVVLLMAFLAIILLRIVKSDFTRYAQDVENEVGSADEETGWKLVHGDVFRLPSHVNLLSGFVGAGAHLFTMTLLLLSLAVAGTFVSNRRGGIVTAIVILYCITSSVGGYVSARMYKQLKGGKWAWNIVFTTLIFPVPLSIAFLTLNSVAVAHSATTAMPFGTILVVLALFVLVAFPLAVLGGIAGKNSNTQEPPCRVAKVPRQIPEVPWYRRGLFQSAIAGLLPFSAISIELHYIFASVWGRKVYTLFGILFLAFVLLALVTSFVVIALTYFQLVVEDYRWWWRSFISGGMAGVFIYLYCFFYYFYYSDMSGQLQTSFYFGYNLVCAFAIFLMLGFVGFLSARRFVRYIYSSIKLE